MRNKHLLSTYVLLFTLLAPFFVFSQSDLESYVNLYPTDPQASGFEKHGSFAPPNSFGAVPISIPIYTIKTEGISIPLSFNYNSTGIKVNQEASGLGLGYHNNCNTIFNPENI